MYCVNMVSGMVAVASMVNVVVGKTTKENEEMDFDDIGTVEGFIMIRSSR